jgi:hypothetical protein
MTMFDNTFDIGINILYPHVCQGVGKIGPPNIICNISANKRERDEPKAALTFQTRYHLEKASKD